MRVATAGGELLVAGLLGRRRSAGGAASGCWGPGNNGTTTPGALKVGAGKKPGAAGAPALFGAGVGAGAARVAVAVTAAPAVGDGCATTVLVTVPRRVGDGVAAPVARPLVGVTVAADWVGVAVAVTPADAAVAVAVGGAEVAVCVGVAASPGGD